MPANTAILPLIDADLPATRGRRRLGQLLVAEKGDARQRALPLSGVDIRARVADRVAEVTVQQRFLNDHDDPIEAIYVFPLAGGCAVADFEFTVAGRTIKGVLAEREQAREQYAQALAEGKRAAMLEQERSDVFTISVGNLPPGEQAAVRIAYSERLPFFEDGHTELRLPLVVAPRYIPGQPLDGASAGDGTESDTDQVPDASRITPPRLAPGFDPETALTVEVELLGGVAADLACSQHAVSQRSQADPASTLVSLSRDDERLDRDFVLRWRLAHDDVSPSLVYGTHDDGRAYGLLSIAAPRTGRDVGAARDVVFVLDRSGSMSGPKIASAARACVHLLRTLGPGDRYTIVAFDNLIEWFEGARRLVAADEDALARGERWLRSVDARGGTEVDAALADALALLDARSDATGRQGAVVLVTDGQVGNEGAVLKRLRLTRGAVRLFVVGVDTAVNAAFLDQLARAGHGTSVLVEPGASLEGALVSIGRDIGRPLVTDLSIEGAGGAVVEAGSVAPSRIPDLFGGRASMMAFRASTAGPVRVRGTSADGSPFEITVSPRAVTFPAVAHLWARERLTDLEDAYRLEPQRADALRTEIVDLSIAHHVLTRFTAFVAVDAREAVANPLERRKVVQPVEMPASWDAEAIGATYRSSAMPFAAGVTLGAPQAARWLHTAPEAAMAKLGDTLGRLTSPEPPDEATSLAGDLPTLLDDLKRAFGQAVPWSAADTERLRSLRKRLAPLEHTLGGRAREWVQRLISILNRIIHLLEQRSGHDEALREAITALEGVIGETPLTWSRKRRFWERSV